MTVLMATRFAAAVGLSRRCLRGRCCQHSGQLLPSRGIAAVTAFRRSSISSSRTPATATLPHDEEEEETDVLIVGGGVVGCALARQLTTLIPGIRVDLVEAGKGPDNCSALLQDDARIPHARSYALSPASLETLGWKENPPSSASTSSTSGAPKRSRIGHYDSMQIWEANQPSFLLFTSHDLLENNNNPQQQQQPSSSRYLGACVEDRYIVQHLWQEIQETGRCRRIHTQSTVSSVQVPQHSSHGLVQVQLQSSSSSSSTTTRKIRTHLLVAADGGNSSIRRLLDIPLTRKLDYNQVALTFTVELEESHKGRAFQRFLAPTATGGGGAEPLALLPTFSDHHATIVWSTSPENVQKWKGHPQLLHHVNDLLQQGPQLFENGSSNPFFAPRGYDQIPKNVHTGGDSIVSNLQYGAEKLIEALQYGPALMAAQEANLPFTAPPRLKTTPQQQQPQQFSFPLSTGHVSTYGDEHRRIALVGDAAHTVHPMAGQGLNLGLQDVADLCRSIQKATDAGMDVNTFLSSHYNVNRQVQVALTLAGIHGLHGMYGMQHATAKHVKSLGMNMIQNVGVLRRQLAQAACHGVAVPM
jgi:ubiquinone biosynthesis UbiH/UbiF/VisC/COQ6 family hydroxylase